MGKIRKVSLSGDAMALVDAAHSLFEVNDCAVRATAIATEHSYKDILEMYAKSGRKARKGTLSMITADVMKELGYDMIVLPPSFFISRYPKPHCRLLKFVTTHHPRRFPTTWVDGNTYMLRSSHHIATVKNGTMHDWSVNALLRVRTIYHVKEH